MLLLSVWLSASFLAANGIFMAMAMSPGVDDGPSDCRVERTITSGTFDEYYALADVGNRPSERHSVNLSLEVTVRNRQEELAVLLSGADRSYQHPDFARTYEMRLTNVYTVLYRETHKLRAYHSPQDKLFPGDHFRLRFLVGRDGNLTVLANDDPARTLLAVVDELPPLDLHYISLASRMNAYPVRYALGCDLEPGLDGSTTSTSPPAGAEASADTTEAGVPAEELRLAPASCPVCARPQRCQVVVKACADNSKNSPSDVGGGMGEEPEQQKYYFYFNLYLLKNRAKAAEQQQQARKSSDGGL